MKTVYIKVGTKIKVNKNVDIDEVISEMDYNFVSNTDGAEFIDTEIEDYEIIN